MAWKKRLLDYDPVLKRTEWCWYHDGTGQVAYQCITDISDILEDNKARYAMTDERAGWKGTWHKIGQVPLGIAFDVLKRTGWGKDKRAVARWVNDKDNRAFLTRPVKL